MQIPTFFFFNLMFVIYLKMKIYVYNYIFCAGLYFLTMGCESVNEVCCIKHFESSGE